ncbi:MAG: hypothetical protein ACI9J3_000223 [Parvicellaceae bacterium]|jgi:hypothetical protein
MTEIRLRPKTDFMQKADLSQILILTQHWVSDLLFFFDELKFFTHLVDKYFILLLKEENINKAQIIVTNIHKFEKEVNHLKDKIQNHIDYLEKLYDVNANTDEALFREQHEDLEQEMTDLIKQFRETKQEVFSLSKRMMETEKLSHLLAN